MTPAEEITTAAKMLRTATFRGAMTATPAVAALIRARAHVAELLEAVAANPDDPGIREGTARHVSCDPTTCPAAAALAVARAINAGGQQ